MHALSFKKQCIYYLGLEAKHFDKDVIPTPEVNKANSGKQELHLFQILIL